MVHIKRSIGYVQIAFGIFLVISTLFGITLVFKHVAAESDLYIDAYNVIKERYGTLSFVESYSFFMTHSYQRFMIYIFISGISMVMIVLGVLTLFQGIAHTRAGADPHHPHALAKIIAVLVLVFLAVDLVFYLVLASGMS